VYRLLVGKPEGKRPLGRTICRWVDNIKMDLLEIGLGGLDWIGLAQDSYSCCDRGNDPGFHKILGNNRVTAQLVASCTELLS
jgi:hypothetical protein